MSSYQPPPESITQAGFKISTRKWPILKAAPIDEMTKKLGITPPEMIFGDNYVKVEHVKSGWSIEFNSFDALDQVDKTGSKMLQVSYSKEWQANRQHVHGDIKEVVKPFDWSYSTDYKGTLQSSSNQNFVQTKESLPIALLSKPDPILFFSSVDLFEDELADNGMSILTVKVRVMPQRMLVLCRFFLRLDGVIFRIRDTRLYIEFATGQVIREYTAREEPYNDVKARLDSSGDSTSLMRDPDQLAKICPITETVSETLTLPV
jgi:type 2A phosphatase activator TIP41